MHTDLTPRCVLDYGDRPRRTHVGLLCAYHHARFTEMLDPAQTGQIFTEPGQRRIWPSIPVLHELLPFERLRTSEQQPMGGVFKSTPPGDMRALVHRDPRSRRGSKRDDHERDALLPTLGSLYAIAAALALRDIHGNPILWPRGAVELSTWLFHRIDLLAAAAWVGEAFDMLSVLQRQLARSAGDPMPEPVGPCWQRVNDAGELQDGGPWECGVQIYLPPQQPRGMDEPIKIPAIRCGGCGYTYPGEDLARLAARGYRRAAS